MKLLFDQNLSPRLPLILIDIYPESVHVREIGMRDTTDTEIWEHAKNFEFVIVSKASDFQARSLLYGSPPKLSGSASATAQLNRSKNCFATIP